MFTSLVSQERTALGTLLAQAFAELGRPHEATDSLALAWQAFLQSDYRGVAEHLSHVDGLSTDLADKLESALAALGVDLS
jgi:hypothetical protein